MKDKEILLVSDFVGVGKVALSTMIPILSTMEVSLSYLPTAVVSNNFGYGEAVIHDLTDFMKDSRDIWEKHKFKFDIIATGIIMNVEQVKIIEEIINWHEEKPLVISDPIMGDSGKIYPGLSEDLVEASREVVLLADIIIPNVTELSLVLGEEYPKNMTEEIIEAWLEKLILKDVRSAIITSVNIDDKHYVYGYSQDKKIFRVEYKHIPVEVGGTGDVFTSLVLGKLGRDSDLKDSIKYATSMLTKIIEKEYDRGLREWAMEVEVERYLQDIYQSL